VTGLYHEVVMAETQWAVCANAATLYANSYDFNWHCFKQKSLFYILI